MKTIEFGKELILCNCCKEQVPKGVRIVENNGYHYCGVCIEAENRAICEECGEMMPNLNEDGICQFCEV